MFRYRGHMAGWGDGGFPVFGLVMMIGFVVLVVVGVILLVRLMRTPVPAVGAPAPFAPPPPGPRPDPALTELRMRYARGEVSRDEYVRMATDLGGAPPPAEPPPA